MQHKLKTQNLDVVVSKTLFLKHKEKQEQEQIAMLETKMDHMPHASEE